MKLIRNSISLTGFPDKPPVRAGIAIGDLAAGLYAVIGTMFALHARNNHPEKRGQLVDVALYESIFSLMEGALPEYDLKGLIRQRTGSTLGSFILKVIKGRVRYRLHVL